MMKRDSSEKRILKSILNISGFVNFVEHPDFILGLVIEECVLLTKASWGAMFSYDEGPAGGAFQVTRFMEDAEKERLSLRLREQMGVYLEKGGERAVLDDVYWNKKGPRARIAGALGGVGEPVMISPIKKRDRFLGLAVLIGKKGGGAFKKGDRENFNLICREASIIIENINLFKAKLQAERMAAVGETMTGIAHYIKNILQGILTASFLLNSGVSDNDMKAVKEAWQVVNKNTKRISDLVMDMLYYSKERRPAKAKVDPKALISDVTELLNSRMEEKEIKLVLSAGELPGYIMADEKGMHRSLLNIVSNAIDACDKDGSVIKIETALDRRRRSFSILVSDNGQGIPAESIASIFCPFYTKKKEKGTGLGLAITKKVVEEHGGSIGIESEPSKGTTFRITLPVEKGAV